MAPAMRDIKHDRGSPIARITLADLHDGVQTCECLSLLPALRCILQQWQQSVSEPCCRTIPLQKFRHDIFAKHEIGEDHRRPVEQQTSGEFFDQFELTGGLVLKLGGGS